MLQPISLTQQSTHLTKHLLKSMISKIKITSPQLKTNFSILLTILSFLNCKLFLCFIMMILLVVKWQILLIRREKRKSIINNVIQIKTIRPLRTQRRIIALDVECLFIRSTPADSVTIVKRLMMQLHIM